jgi:pimeloyl-ACP methyl ester carboxylesterase
MAEKSGIASSFFHKSDLRMHYLRSGRGPHVLLALHGFGRSSADFVRFTRPLHKGFTVYAADIFFHGKSTVERTAPDRNPITPEEFTSFFTAFFDHISAGKVWLMGYSLGGRLAMVLAQNMPGRIGGLYLFAPDGLNVNRWYGLLSHYAAGRALFRFFRRRPSWFFRALRFLLRAGVVSPRTADFVESQIRTSVDQERVYMTWCFLRKLEPDHKLLGERLTANRISLDLYFGLYDNIIREGQAKKLLRHFDQAQVQTLRSGHFLLTAANMLLILKEERIQLPAEDPDRG